MKKLKRFFRRLIRGFSAKPKPYLLDNTFRIVPAFEFKGETYYMHEDPSNTATGRGLSAFMIMEEMTMRCSVDYLQAHIEACDKIFTDKERINLPLLMQLNRNLKERVDFLAVVPQHVFKLASVVFFTKEESPYRYDQAYNKKKIEAWSKEPGMYDFFCQGHLKTLVPYLALPESNSESYLAIQEKISQLHARHLQESLSKSLKTTDF